MGRSYDIDALRSAGSGPPAKMLLERQVSPDSAEFAFRARIL
jgi:hypothetical protein